MKTNRTTTMKPVLHSLLIAWTTYANKLQSGCRVTGRTVSAPVVYRALMQVFVAAKMMRSQFFVTLNLESRMLFEQVDEGVWMNYFQLKRTVSYFRLFVTH